MKAPTMTESEARALAATQPGIVVIRRKKQYPNTWAFHARFHTAEAGFIRYAGKSFDRALALRKALIETYKKRKRR